MEGSLAELDAFVKSLSDEDRTIAGFPSDFCITKYEQDLRAEELSDGMKIHVVRRCLAEAKSDLGYAAENRKLEQEIRTELNEFDSFIICMSQEDRVLIGMEAYNAGSFGIELKTIGDLSSQLRHLKDQKQEMESIIDNQRRATEQKAKGINIIALLWRYCRLHDMWALFVRGRLSVCAGGHDFTSHDSFIYFCGCQAKDGSWLDFLDSFSEVLDELKTETDK